MEKPNCKSNISLLFEKVIYTLVCPADLTGSIEPLKFISQLEAQLAELTRPEKPNYPWDAIDSFKTSFIKEKIILKLIIIPQANLPGPWKMAKKIFSFSDIDIDYLTIIKDVVMKP